MRAFIVEEERMPETEDLVEFDYLLCSWCGHEWKPRKIILDTNYRCPRCKNKSFWAIGSLLEEQTDV